MGGGDTRCYFLLPVQPACLLCCVARARSSDEPELELALLQPPRTFVSLSNVRPMSAAAGGGHKGYSRVFICINITLGLRVLVLGILEEGIGCLHQMLSLTSEPLALPSVCPPVLEL